ncbi:MAG TPA: hypothetical protein VFG10_11670 [Saprospiraceae bacterium]|nr:hypothetical protein [Saprospiraceae bacterium]
MKTLYDLARINQKNSRIVESMISIDKESPLKKLNSLLSSKHAMDDNAAMIEIYGKKNISAFSRLKTRLKDILIRSTLLQNINLEASDTRLSEAHNHLRYALATKLLVDLRARSLSVEIAEKAILKAIKYSLTESVILLARLLVTHYGSSEYNKYKLNKYLIIQEKYLRVYASEIKAENYYLDLQRTQLQSLAAPSDSTKEKAKKYVEDLESLDDIKSFAFIMTKYRVKSAYYEYLKDYDSLLTLSENILKEFGSEFKTGTFLQNINVRRAWALIQAGRNDEAISSGLKDLSRIPNGSLGWYFIAHYILKAQLYEGNYSQAIQLITQMIDNTKFQKIGENFKELFYTTLGYIHLILESGLVNITKENLKTLPEFKIGKFLNTTPVFSKDKRGINVSILLMHIAFLLQRKDYDTIIDRMDSLNQYAYRYLRKDDSFRSSCMIKMVVQMTKADFNPIRTERYTRELLQQLKEVKLAGSGENIETEIIPYEVLWEIMTKSL